MITFSWAVFNETQMLLIAREGRRVLRRRFDKSLFWLRGADLEPYKRRLEQRLAARFSYLP